MAHGWQFVSRNWKTAKTIGAILARPLKILFLMEDLCFGGTQKQNLALAARLDRDRFNPAMLTLTGPTNLDGVAAQANVPVFHLGRGRRAAPLFFARLGASLKKINPDILVPCTALPNIWGRLWGRALKIPVIVGTCRGGGAPRRQHERVLWRLASHIVCNSPQLLQAMQKRGVPAGHLTYIPNGVDTDYFKPGAGTGQVILCAARLAGDKDHITLLKAFAIVAEKFPEATLRLVGEGPAEGVLRKFVRENLAPHVAARVVFAGAAMDMRPHYAGADVFALASLREGQPNVILEAMSSGLPVCSTNAGGIPSLVAEGRSGLLCEPANPGALAANLSRMLENARQAQDMGAAGRRIVEENFSFESMTKAHQDLFSSLWHNFNAKNGGDI